MNKAISFIHSIKNLHSSCSPGGLALLLVLLLPLVGQADTTVDVDCANPGNDDGVSVFGDLSGAFDYLENNDPGGSNIINVRAGTCTPSQNLSIDHLTGNLDIKGPDVVAGSPPQAIVDLGGGCGAPPPRRRFYIRNSMVHFSDLSITGGWGIELTDSDLALIEDVTLENSRGHGVEVEGSSGSVLRMLGSGPNNEISGHCGHGVVVSRASSTVIRAGSIQNNGFFGVFAAEAGRTDVGGNALVEGNLFGGIAARLGSVAKISGQATIRNNGNNPDPTHVFFQWRSGVHVYLGSTLSILGPSSANPGPTIESNTGPGVLVDLNSTMTTRNVTVQNNSDGGLSVIHDSTAEFRSAVVSTGNTGGDLGCDSDSLIYGDMSGVSINHCSGAQRGGGNN